MNRYVTGLLGEWRAEKYARKQGMRILERRYRAAHGEIDLIAREGNTVVFIEVKARPHGRMLEGAKAVNLDKRRRLRAAAQAYLAAHPAFADARFDLIEITAAGLRHVRNAF